MNKTQSMHLLMVSSSPSDLAEFEATAKALVCAGHCVTLVYFYAGSSRHVHEVSLQRIRELAQITQKLDTYAIDVDKGFDQLSEGTKPAITDDSPSGRQPISRNILAIRQMLINKCTTINGRTQVLASNATRSLRSWMEKDGSLLIYHRFLRNVRRIRPKFQRPIPTIYGVLTGLPLLRVYRYYRRICEEILTWKPHHVVLIPEDVVGPLWPTLVHAALRKKIPTLVLPYTLANQEEAFKSLKDVDQLQTKLNRAVAFLFPQWRLQRDGHDIVRMPSGHIYAHHWLGIAPPDPWMMNSGNAKLVCVDSQASFEYFAKGGIPERKLRITGSVSQDELYQQLSDKPRALERLHQELQLRHSKPLLLVSGCPNQLAGRVPHCEFKDMESLAAHVGKALQPLINDFHIVVRPHPNYPDFGAMLSPYGVLTSMTPTAQLVPICDAFIAFASATIRWAVACGIPTINYDVFHYGYSDFAEVSGVITVSEAEEFERLALQIRPSCAEFTDLRKAAQAHATHWSVLDGRSTQRLLDAINEAQEL